MPKKKKKKKDYLKKLAKKRLLGDVSYKIKVGLRDKDGNDLLDKDSNPLEGKQWYYSPVD